jgi:hypothetical protein
LLQNSHWTVLSLVASTFFDSELLTVVDQRWFVANRRRGKGILVSGKVTQFVLDLVVSEVEETIRCFALKLVSDAELLEAPIATLWEVRRQAKRHGTQGRRVLWCH